MVLYRWTVGVHMILWMAQAALAFCGTYVGGTEARLENGYSEVAIVRQAGVTTLSMANDYQGPPEGFAVVVPVPKVLEEGDVRVVAPAIFDQLRAYTEPRLVSYTCEELYPPLPKAPAWQQSHSSCAVAYSAETGGGDFYDPGANVEAEFIVGEYDVVVLSAQDSEGLLGWLDTNGYAVAPNQEALLQEYIDGGSYFFAAKVDPERLSDEQSMLSPLQFSYASDVFSLPIRLGTANSPGEQELVVYALTEAEDGRVGIANYEESKLESACLTEGEFSDFYAAELDEVFSGDQATWIAEYGWLNKPLLVKCDPCPPGIDTRFGFSLSGLRSVGFEFQGSVDTGWSSTPATPSFYVTRLHMRYTPEQATQDLVLYTSGITENTQQRYIVYESYLEDAFPVCGEGMREDPGSCADISSDFAKRVAAVRREEARAASNDGGRSALGGLGLLLFIGLRRRSA